MATNTEQVLLRVALDSSALSGGLLKVKHSISEGFKDIGKDIIAGFTFGAIVSKMEGVFDQVERIQSAASKTGVDVESFQKLSTLANEELPHGAETFEGAVTKLNVKIGEGAAELQKWGIHSTNAKAALYEIADKMAATEDPAKRAAMAVDLMGKSGADMVPFLERGAAALEKMANSKPAWTREEIESIDESKKGMEQIQGYLTIGTGKIISSFASVAAFVGKLSSGPEALAKSNFEERYFKAEKSADKTVKHIKTQAEIEAEAAAAKALSDKQHEEFNKRSIEFEKHRVQLQNQYSSKRKEYESLRKQYNRIDNEAPSVEQLAGRDYMTRLHEYFGAGGAMDLEAGNGPFAKAAQDALFFKNKQMFDVIQGNAKFDKDGNLMGGAAFEDRNQRMRAENLLRNAGLQTPEMMQRELIDRMNDTSRDMADLLQVAKFQGIKISDK